MLDESDVEDSWATQQLRDAAMRNDLDLVEAALQDGAKVNGYDRLHRRTALHFAVSCGAYYVVKRLLASAADPNIVDCKGNTPLHLATIGQSPEIAKLLLEAGTNPHSQDSLGRTPLHWAKQRLEHLRTNIHMRRLQFADDDERAELLLRLQCELQQMMDEFQRYMSSAPGQMDCEVEFSPSKRKALQVVQAKIGAMQSLDEVDEITDLLDSICL